MFPWMKNSSEPIPAPDLPGSRMARRRLSVPSWFNIVGKGCFQSNQFGSEDRLSDERISDEFTAWSKENAQQPPKPQQNKSALPPRPAPAAQKKIFEGDKLPPVPMSSSSEASDDDDTPTVHPHPLRRRWSVDSGAVDVGWMEMMRNMARDLQKPSQGPPGATMAVEPRLHDPVLTMLLNQILNERKNTCAVVQPSPAQPIHTEHNQRRNSVIKMDLSFPIERAFEPDTLLKWHHRRKQETIEQDPRDFWIHPEGRFGDTPLNLFE